MGGWKFCVFSIIDLYSHCQLLNCKRIKLWTYPRFNALSVCRHNDKISNCYSSRYFSLIKIHWDNSRLSQHIIKIHTTLFKFSFVKHLEHLNIFYFELTLLHKIKYATFWDCNVIKYENVQGMWTLLQGTGHHFCSHGLIHWALW